MKKVSVNEFKGHVVEGVKHICRDLGWDFNKETHRGNAFQLWVARLMSDIDGGYDNPPDDAVLRAGNDLTADVVLIDSTRRHVVIVQCKFLSLAKKDVPLDEHEVTTFFGRHDQFANRDWVRQHGSGPAFELLGDYGELLESGYGVTFRYVATGKTTPRIDSVLAEQNASYAKRGLPLVCELYDFYGLKEYYVRGQSIEEGIPDVVELHLQKDRFIEKSDPRPTLIALIKGNQLRDLHKRHKDALFAFNIRGYLGNRGINDSIKKTARERPADFLYLNNGVSAICTDYTVERNLLRAKKLQIINGAQTVGTISREPPSDDLEVLFRLTQGEHVTTDKGFNRDIIQCNNTQNIIKVSDFRSNDPIQVWLERQIAALRASEPLPKCRYIRKRSSQRGIGIPIPLELFAKVRYSYLAEPTLVHENPRSLWTSAEDGGSYEVAFGVNGVLTEVWSPEVFDQALLALATYLRIEQETKEIAKRDPEQRFLRRLRFHALSLLGLELNQLAADTVHAAISSKTEFNRLWDTYWPEAIRVIINVHYSAVEAGGMTMFAFARSTERWAEMKRLYKRYQSVAARSPAS